MIGNGGTIFLAQKTKQAVGLPATASIVGVNRTSGTRIFEIPVPESRRRLLVPSFGCANWYYGGNVTTRYASYIAGLVVDATGTANVLVQQEDYTEVYNAPDFFSLYCDVASLTNNAQVLLYRISPSGDMTTTTLHAYTGEPMRLTGVGGRALLPDAEGGILAHWGCWGTAGCGSSVRGRYAGPMSLSEEFDLSIAPTISGSQHLGYGRSYDFGSGSTSSVMAFDMTNGSVLWSSPVSGSVSAALEGDQVAVVVDGGTTTIVGSVGNVVASGLPGLGPTNGVGDVWVGMTNGIVNAAIVPDVALDNLAGWPVRGGNRSAQNAPPLRYRDEQTAALAALNFIYPFARAGDREWGGRIVVAMMPLIGVASFLASASASSWITIPRTVPRTGRLPHFIMCISNPIQPLPYHQAMRLRQSTTIP